MRRESHVRFCESLRGKIPRATRPCWYDERPLLVINSPESREYSFISRAQAFRAGHCYANLTTHLGMSTK